MNIFPCVNGASVSVLNSIGFMPLFTGDDDDDDDAVNALLFRSGVQHILSTENNHRSIFRTSERERVFVFWLRLPQQASICLPLGDQRARSAPRPAETSEQFGLENGALLNGAQRCVRPAEVDNMMANRHTNRHAKTVRNARIVNRDRSQWPSNRSHRPETFTSVSHVANVAITTVSYEISQ